MRFTTTDSNELRLVPAKPNASFPAFKLQPFLLFSMELEKLSRAWSAPLISDPKQQNHFAWQTSALVFFTAPQAVKSFSFGSITAAT
jgi:hypothetical protein